MNDSIGPENSTTTAEGNVSANPLRTVALLDDKDIYIGMIEVADDALTDRHLPEITECDLPINKYKWHRAKNTFLPIRKAAPLRDPEEPDTMRAIFEGFTAIQASGVIDLPLTTKRWLTWYGKSFDGRDALTPEATTNDTEA